MFISVLFALMLAVAVSGCSKKPEDAIVGKWTVDVDALSEMDEFKKMPEEERKAALELAKGFMASMNFEFTKDKAIVEAMGKKEEGSYTIKSSSGNQLVLEMKKPGSDKPEEVKVDVDGDKLVLHMGEKEKFPLKRK
jgi:HSP20 family molecular chaperone IbpA